MVKLHKIGFRGETFHARSGQRLLDAALASGIDMPHDCRAGRCGSCLAQLKSGITLGGETRQRGVVHACQAMVFSDLDVEVEETPAVVVTKARVAAVSEIAKDIVEVVIAPQDRLDILPGQYCRFRFRGFPERCFSPTAPLSSLKGDGAIRLHIKRVRGGRVTPELGRAIKPGHTVWIEGPLGSAYLRPRLPNRLVLVGSGTGFAPVWAVAAAALTESFARQIVLIAATRDPAAFYMGPALVLAGQHARVATLACIEQIAAGAGSVVKGRANQHLPPLTAEDIVYAAGSPKLVDAIGDAAQRAGATFYADPFEAGPPPSRSWLDGAKAWLGAATG